MATGRKKAIAVARLLYGMAKHGLLDQAQVTAALTDAMQSRGWGQNERGRWSQAEIERHLAYARDHADADLAREVPLMPINMGAAQPQAQPHPSTNPASGNSQAPTARTIITIDFPSMPEVEPAPRRFVVGGWLPAPCLSSCYGGPGIGKSMIAQQLATCVVTGREFFGCAVTHGPCSASSAKTTTKS